MNVDIIVFDGVDELDVFGPLEVFRRAEALGAELYTHVRSVAVVEWLTAAFGTRLAVDGQFRPGEADVVVVPGGGWVAHSGTGARAEVQRGELPRLLAEAKQAGCVLAGVCTGAMVLAHAGLVGHRPATTHHDALADLAAIGAEIVPQRVVDDGDLITSGGVTSGIDLALWLVSRYFGASLAQLVAEGLEYAWAPAPGPQA